MPLLGVVFYFYKSPRFFSKDVIMAKLISLSILTFIVPILLFFLLKSVRKVTSLNLETTKERILPLLLNCIILCLVLMRVLKSSQFIELYFFFTGILISNMTCLILAILKFKVSIHMIAVSYVVMFFVILSIYFSINIIGVLALSSIIIGAVATSRLCLKAHTGLELLMGIIIGMLPQLVMANYWL